MKTYKLILLGGVIFSLSGCAAITLPKPGSLIKDHRLIGTDSVKLGMTRDEVKEIWGEPDSINYVQNEELWGGKREEWIYNARYGKIPINAGYLSKTKKLYFDGENLTNIIQSEE